MAGGVFIAVKIMGRNWVTLFSQWHDMPGKICCAQLLRVAVLLV